MSIQTEINRINTAKNNILNSISNKGVDTSSVETLGDIPELIDSITTKEDLDAELTEQSALLTNQGTTIDDIKIALQGKIAGGGEEIVLQEKTITPTTSQQNVIADTGYNGLSKVVVNAVTSAIDSDIKATNIRSGVNILGVTGTLEEGITPSGTLNITTNGTHNVTNYASANVNVPSEDLTSELNTYETYLDTQETTIEDIMTALEGKGTGSGITPEGTINITSNGTHDVTNYASAEVNVPSVQDTTIEDGFVNRTLTSYTNDRVKTVGNQAFRGFSSLKSISLPNATTLNAYALDGCSGLTSVNLSKVTTLNNYAMQGCSSLETLEFQQKMSTQGAVWNNCGKLTKLILRSTSMCGLGNKNCFNNTPIASGTGFIYVPDDLVDTYKANTNWSNFASQIKGISELGV